MAWQIPSRPHESIERIVSTRSHESSSGDALRGTDVMISYSAYKAGKPTLMSNKSPTTAGAARSRSEGSSGSYHE